MARTTHASAILLALVCAASVAARADWLVTKDGGKFETQGTWTVKGKLVVFTLPNGSFSSVRLEKVDLEASKAATEQAKRKAEEPPPEIQVEKPRKKSILSLTDKDFKKTPPPSTDAAAKDNKPAPGTESTPVNGIQVLSWNRIPASESKADGVQLAGKLRNGSSDLATDIVVTANFYDDSGTLIAKVPAELSAATLPAGETATFTVTAAGTYSFGSVKFQTTSQGLKAKPSSPPTSGKEPAKSQGTSSSSSSSSQPAPTSPPPL